MLGGAASRDRKSTRLNSSHSQTSYAVFCLKKKKLQPRVSPVRHRCGFILVMRSHRTIVIDAEHCGGLMGGLVCAPFRAVFSFLLGIVLLLALWDTALVNVSARPTAGELLT